MSANNAWNAWKIAAKTQAVDSALRAIYGEVDAAVRARGPKCEASGRCCKFNSYDHLLYVTGLEIAWFLLQAEKGKTTTDSHYHNAIGALSLPILSPRQLPDGCAWQVDGLCSAHGFRPLGCRVYFCEKGTEEWQQATYEKFQSQLKALHETLALPYEYMEWRGGVMAAHKEPRA